MTTPIRTKTYFVEILLIVLSALCAILAVILSNKTVFFFPSIQSTLVNGETNLQLGSGQMPLAHAGIFLSFIFTYLLFEFYSFKPAFYTTLCSALAIILTLVIVTQLQIHVLKPDTSHGDAVLSEALTFDRKTFVALALGMALGVGLALMIAASIKRIMHNYLMFIRFPIASLIGFGVFTGVTVYITQFQTLALPSLILAAITPYSHFAALIVGAVVPLYVLRLVFGIFRGRVPKEKKIETEPKVESKSLFKPAEPEVLPIQTATPEVIVEQKQELPVTPSA